MIILGIVSQWHRGKTSPARYSHYVTALSDYCRLRNSPWSFFGSHLKSDMSRDSSSELNPLASTYSSNHGMKGQGKAIHVWHDFYVSKFDSAVMHIRVILVFRKTEVQFLVITVPVR
jgi:hypothetical protein